MKNVLLQSWDDDFDSCPYVEGIYEVPDDFDFVKNRREFFEHAKKEKLVRVSKTGAIHGMDGNKANRLWLRYFKDMYRSIKFEAIEL